MRPRRTRDLDQALANLAKLIDLQRQARCAAETAIDDLRLVRKVLVVTALQEAGDE